MTSRQNEIREAAQPLPPSREPSPMSSETQQFSHNTDQPRLASRQRLDEMITSIISSYREVTEVHNWMWEDIFLVDFAEWDDEAFRRASPTIIRNLRMTLLHHGVYTPTDGTSVVEHIINLRNRYVDWPSDKKPTTKLMELRAINRIDADGNQMVQNSALPGFPNNQAVPPPLKMPSASPNFDVKPTQHEVPSMSQYTRELSTLTKMSTEDSKYGGTKDIFETCCQTFRRNCLLSGYPWQLANKIFPIMLKDQALLYYNLHEERFCAEAATIEDLWAEFESYFESPEYRISAMSEFNNLTLAKIISVNPGKPLAECLDDLINQLQDLRLRLRKENQSDEFMHQRLLTACETVNACEFACMKPSSTLPGLINELRAATTSYDRKHPPSTSVNFVDRKFYTNRTDKTPSKIANRQRKKCFVCGKEGCWSSNHPKDEKGKRVTAMISEIEGPLPDEVSDNDELSSSDEVSPTAMLTALGPIDGPSSCKDLLNRAAFHAIAGADDPYLPQFPVESDDQIAFWTTCRYPATKFFGVMIDTGTNIQSVGGLGQYKALQRQFGTDLLDSKPLSEATSPPINFGKGSARPQLAADVRTPIGIIHFHIVDADIPFLLSLQDIDRTGFYYNNQTNTIVNNGTNTVVPVIRYNGHAWITWTNTIGSFFTGKADSNSLTEQELRQLHRRFGHPSASRLQRLLSRSKHTFDEETLRHISEICSQCQQHSRPPHRFKFTLKDDTEFNHTIIVDIMYLGTPAEPVLHVVDEATRFQAARFLENISAKQVWDALRHCWMDTYLGPPDHIVTDAGTQFISEEFVANAKKLSIQARAVPIEAHHSIGAVERYHAVLRRAYDIIRSEIPSVVKSAALQMSVKAVNDTAGPDGLTPTLLVFGAYPRMGDEDSSVSTKQRGQAVAKAMREVRELKASRDVSGALRQRNGPIIDDLLALPIGSDVLVYRENGGWQGPFKMVQREGHEASVQLDHGVKKFRITSLKKYPIQNIDVAIQTEEPNADPAIDEENNADTDLIIEPEQSLRRNVPRKRQLPKRYCQDSTALISTKEEKAILLAKQLRADGAIRSPGPPFEESRKKEIEGLINEGVFEVLNKTPENCRLFGCRFVDEIKYNNQQPYEKSRLVVQAFNDREKASILTQSPTIQRTSQRLIICIAAMKNQSLYCRDISQAYVNSKTQLSRNMFVRAPSSIDLGGNVLKVVRPLYGIPEAGNHWYKTYHNHHTEKLGLKTSTFDPCLLFNDDGICGLQTDDTLFTGNDKYLKQEQEELALAKFPAKPVDVLTKNHPISFNGTTITQLNNAILLQQYRQCCKIEPIDKSKDIKKQYVCERARGAYVASMSQPEAAFALSKAAQTISPSDTHVTYLNKCLNWQKTHASRGLRFISTDRNETKMYVFVDAAFANNEDHSSQLGFVIVVGTEIRQSKDEIDIKGNIVHWSSTKCKRVTRSVLGSELYAMVAGFDIGQSLQSTLNAIMKRTVPLILCTDSYSLYDCMIKLNTTSEKRLMIDIMGLRESYERREISEIRWIEGTCNPADALTKDKPCSALKHLVEHNALKLRTKGWVER